MASGVAHDAWPRLSAAGRTAWPSPDRYVYSDTFCVCLSIGQTVTRSDHANAIGPYNGCAVRPPVYPGEPLDVRIRDNSARGSPRGRSRTIACAISLERRPLPRAATPEEILDRCRRRDRGYRRRAPRAPPRRRDSCGLCLLYAQGAAMFAPNKHGPVRAGALEAQRQMSTPTFAGVVCRKRCRRQGSCGYIGTRTHRRGQTSPSNSITSTASPASTLPWSCPSTMKQLASLMERKMPEPWAPVMRTVRLPPLVSRKPRWYSVRPDF